MNTRIFYKFNNVLHSDIFVFPYAIAMKIQLFDSAYGEIYKKLNLPVMFLCSPRRLQMFVS